jgi:hypothetical protein
LNERLDSIEAGLEEGPFRITPDEIRAGFFFTLDKDYRTAGSVLSDRDPRVFKATVNPSGFSLFD